MKTVIFHILRTFRWPIVLASKIFSALMVIILLYATFGNPSTEPPNLIMTFIFAVLFGMVSWYYDVLLKKLEPIDTRNRVID